MQKAVIFDMDGVIIDSEPLHTEVVVSLLKRMGADVPLSRIETYIGVSNSRMWTELLRDFALGKTVPEILELQHSENIEILNRKEGLEIPGIRKLMQDLKEKNIPIAIASSSLRDYIEAVVRKLGLEKFIKVIVSGEEVKNGKPHPDIFLKTAEIMGILPENCVVLEDSAHGVEGAIQAGMRVIGFQNPNSGNQNLTKSDRVVSSIELLDTGILENLFMDRE